MEIQLNAGLVTLSSFQAAAIVCFILDKYTEVNFILVQFDTRKYNITPS